MLDTLCQIVAASCGVTAIWFLGRKEPWRRWGFICGIIAQPCWFYTFVHNGQWPLLIAELVYFYGWSQGIYFYWIRRDK